jgi:hypothetical protein
MERKLPEAILNAKQLGTAFLRPFWNTELLGGLGDIDVEVLDTFEVFPFAYTKTMKETEGVIHARWVSYGYIKKKYPSKAADVKMSLTSQVENKDVPDRSKDTNRGSEMYYAQVTDTTGTETHYLAGPQGTGIDTADLKRVLLITVYLRDESVETSKDDSEQKGIKVDKAKYPNGRVMTIASGILLDDYAFQFENFPGIIDFVNYSQPNEFWGMSDISQIKEGQKGLNKLNASIIDAINRDVYRQRFILAQSGIDIDNYTVTFDSVYETNVANPVQETGQFSLPQAVLSYPDIMEKAIEKTSGAVEFYPNNGSRPPSGRTLAQIQEMSLTRIRPKLRNMEYGIRMLGVMWLEMILKNYTETRIMRLFNAANNQQEYVYMFREEDPQKAAVIKQQMQQAEIEGTQKMDPQTQQPIPGSGQKKYQYVLNMAEIKGDFDLIVATGSTVSVSQVATFDQASQLFQLKAIDQQALLDAADYPQKEEVLKRMRQQAQAGMQMQQQKVQTPIQVQTLKSKTDIQKELIKGKQKAAELVDNRTSKIADILMEYHKSNAASEAKQGGDSKGSEE